MAITFQNWFQRPPCLKLQFGWIKNSNIINHAFNKKILCNCQCITLNFLKWEQWVHKWAICLLKNLQRKWTLSDCILLNRTRSINSNSIIFICCFDVWLWIWYIFGTVSLCILSYLNDFIWFKKMKSFLDNG